MGGFGDFFLGTKPKINEYDTLTGGQRSIANGLGNYLTPQMGQGVPGYTGKLTAGPSQYEQQGLNTLGNYIAQPSEATGWGSAALKTQLSGAPSTNINPQASEDYFNNSVRAPLMKQFNEDIMPQVRERYNSGGMFYGTPRERAENNALQDLEGNLVSQKSNLAYQDEQARRDLAESAAKRQLAALPQGLAYSQEPLTRVAASQNYGDLPRTLEQTDLGNQFNEWLRTQPQNNPAIQTAMNYINMTQKGMYQQPGAVGIIGSLDPTAVGSGLGGMGYGGSYSMSGGGGQRASGGMGNGADVQNTLMGFLKGLGGGTEGGASTAGSYSEAGAAGSDEGLGQMASLMAMFA